MSMNQKIDLPLNVVVGVCVGFGFCLGVGFSSACFSLRGSVDSSLAKKVDGIADKALFCIEKNGEVSLRMPPHTAMRVLTFLSRVSLGDQGVDGLKGLWSRVLGEEKESAFKKEGGKEKKQLTEGEKEDSDYFGCFSEKY
jgi:hypothetical protein